MILLLTTVASTGSCIVTGSTDYTAQVWNLETGKCDRRLEGHTGTVQCLMAREFSADYPLCLATGSMDGTVSGIHQHF